MIIQLETGSTGGKDVRDAGNIYAGDPEAYPPSPSRPRVLSKGCAPIRSCAGWDFVSRPLPILCKCARCCELYPSSLHRQPEDYMYMSAASVCFTRTSWILLPSNLICCAMVVLNAVRVVYTSHRSARTAPSAHNVKKNKPFSQSHQSSSYGSTLCG